MHRERYVVPEAAAVAVEAAHRERRPVVAVGTTVVRTLEAAWNGDRATARFRSPPSCSSIPVTASGWWDELLTNFHTPRSSLLALVSALAGEHHIRTAYATAVRMRYRFFSYGDAMLIR